MKYLLLSVLAALFIAVPVMAGDEKPALKRPGPEEEYNRLKEKKKLVEQWGILSEIPEEDRNRLRKLYDSDQKAFQKEVARIVAQIQEKEKELDRKVKALAEKYKAAKDPDKKQEAYEELRQLTRKIFMDKMEKNRKRLEFLETRVKAVRRQYEFRKKNADKIIQARLDALLSDMDFDW